MKTTRRSFLISGGVFCGLQWLARVLNAAGLANVDRTIKAARSLRITDIEVHQIVLPYHDFNAQNLFRYHGLNIQMRTILVAKTNVDGLEGYADAWGTGPKKEQIEKYIGTNPFDWIGDEGALATNMAMFDVMGKFLKLPAWKLIGSKVRGRIPVAAWTVSQPPKQMAAEVEHAASQGYRWLKYHIDEVQNVIDQTVAMQKVAPAGFKIHYDFNGNSNFKAVAPVVRQLEKFSIAGRIEDPISANDPEGWRRIRAMSSLPILAHHAPVNFITKGVVDGHMCGHQPVASAAKVAAIAEHANIPIMLQNAGGTMNQAFLAHQAAVFKTATIDHVNLARLWKDDVTNENMPIKDGFVDLPKGNGHGITINFEKLKKYESAPRPKQEQFLVRIRYKDGLTIYTRHDPHLPGCTDNMRYMRRLLGNKIPGPVPAYDNDVSSDFWDDTESPEFQEIWKETKQGFTTRKS